MPLGKNLYKFNQAFIMECLEATKTPPNSKQAHSKSLDKQVCTHKSTHKVILLATF